MKTMELYFSSLESCDELQVFRIMCMVFFVCIQWRKTVICNFNPSVLSLAFSSEQAGAEEAL